MAEWQPHHESLRVTLKRTVGIALVGGAVLALFWGGLARWPITSAMMLWFSFGGHWLELWYLDWLRPRLPGSRLVQIAARIAVWFVGGVALGFGMRFTALVLTGLHPPAWATWWVAGLAFIGVELVAHTVLQLRGHNSFFNGRG
ncbi:MAG TPA: hypothetical protein VIP11_10435 [Gemmatimonadaceae bacterium]